MNTELMAARVEITALRTEVGRLRDALELIVRGTRIDYCRGVAKYALAVFTREEDRKKND